MNLKVTRRWPTITKSHATKIPILFHTMVGGDETSDIVNIGGEGSRLVRGAIGIWKHQVGIGVGTKGPVFDGIND